MPKPVSPKREAFKPPAMNMHSGYMVQVFAAHNLNPDEWVGWEIGDKPMKVNLLEDDCTMHPMEGTDGNQYVGACSPCEFGGEVFIPYEGADFITLFVYVPNMHGVDIPAEEYCRVTDTYVLTELRTGPEVTTPVSTK